MLVNSPDLNSEIVATLKRCKGVLVDHYGDLLHALILFGSAARQTLAPESDLDLLVVLHPPFDYFQELHTLVNVLYPVQLEASHWISAKPALVQEFESGRTQLYRNIQQEGVSVYRELRNVSATDAEQAIATTEVFLQQVQQLLNQP